MNIIKSFLVVFVVLFAFSCSKMKVDNPLITNDFKNGILVLNEGLFNLNNASLSWINKNSGGVNSTIFEEKSGRQLGDTGNDLLRYGSKIYIVVNVSSTVEVLDANNLKSLKQIAMVNNGIAKQPRNCIAHKGKVYVSCFDGFIDVIDTTSLLLEKRIKVGTNPENLLIKNDFLLVSNSGGLNGSLMDSTISVIDIVQQKEIKKIVVGTNPGKLVEGENDEFYVIARGNYQTIPSRLKKVNLTAEKVVKMFDMNITSIERFENDYLITLANSLNVSLFSSKDEVIINSNFINTTNLKTVYKVLYIQKQKKIVVLDANNYVNTGNLFEYNQLGELLNKYHVGLNPNSVIYYE